MCIGTMNIGKIKEHEGKSPTRINGLHKAFICGLNQFLCFFIHVSNKEGFIEVTVKTVVVDCDVHCIKKWWYIRQSLLCFVTNNFLQITIFNTKTGLLWIMKHNGVCVEWTRVFITEPPICKAKTKGPFLKIANAIAREQQELEEKYEGQRMWLANPHR